MAYAIENYLSLSVTDLQRMGYLERDTNKKGVITWSRDGRPVARVVVSVTMSDAPMVCISYLCDGVPVRLELQLFFQPSNLDPSGTTGYYYFSCPETFAYCRKLYLVDGRFMSRHAFRHIYQKQLDSKKTRLFMSYVDAVDKIQQLSAAPYRKEFYRGRPTPYRRQLERLAHKIPGAREKVLQSRDAFSIALVGLSKFQN